MDKRIPKIVSLFWRTENGDLSDVPPSTHGANNFNAIGEFKDFQLYLLKNPSWVEMTPLERIIKALEIEADSRSDIVGRPFAIIEIKAARTRWISHGVCPDESQRESHGKDE
jgi:hypothetical protein